MQGGGSRRVNIQELNPHIVCVLCGGYYIDATTIIECLHSFCKTCIIRYLETSKYCPICDVQVHKTRPLLNIRVDHTLQDLVYKLVPGLFTHEMRKRRDFYARNPDEDGSSSKKDMKLAVLERTIYTEDEQISLALEFSPDGKPIQELESNKRKLEEVAQVRPERPEEGGDNKSFEKKNSTLPNGGVEKRYLLCPAAFTIGHLKKFVRLKFGLSDKYEVDVFHTDEPLGDLYTLMDIAYIYTWRRRCPLRLFYSIYEVPGNPAKKRKIDHNLAIASTSASSSLNVAPASTPTESTSSASAASTSASGENTSAIMPPPKTPSTISQSKTSSDKALSESASPGTSEHNTKSSTSAISQHKTSSSSDKTSSKSSSSDKK
jgi:polycomb group RING finger protein 4